MAEGIVATGDSGTHRVAGYTRIEQLVNADENVIAGLHGMGPKGIRILRETLAEKGLSFAGK